jgi:hypothetical protein
VASEALSLVHEELSRSLNGGLLDRSSLIYRLRYFDVWVIHESCC